MYEQNLSGNDDTGSATGPNGGADFSDGSLTQTPHEGGGESNRPPSGSMGLLAQLQRLITQVASAHVTREVAAKAAELAAVAAEKAGPAAHAVAERTEEVGQSVAERATAFASSMRSDPPPDTEASQG